ncbi:hypothetical protein lerEdw1_011777 [Lerista edwardsae]|nr:hypothetical protein lerEdw1_011777 [Lerista edwardsae]
MPLNEWTRLFARRSLIPVREVLKQKHYIAERTKQIYRGRTGSAYERRSSKQPIIKPEQYTEDKTVTSAIQLIAMQDLQELHLYLRRLKLPLLSAVLRLEEKNMVKQKESKRSSRKDLMNLKKTEIQEEDEMATKFKLSGCQMPFYSVSDEIQKYAEKERNFFDYVHDELRNVVHPVPPTMPVHAPVCIEKRIFARAFGTIRLRPLHAIDKAYWASQKCDMQLNKERQIMRMLIAHAAAEDYISRLRKANTETCRKRYEENKLMVNDMLRENLRKREMAIVNNRKKFVQYLDNTDSKATERTYVQVFNSQHTSLARGLLQLDGWRKREESINQKKTAITQKLEEQKHRKEVFKNFHDQRLRMLRKQNASEKSYRKFVTNEMVKERLQQSKARAKAVKTPTMKIWCPLPVIGSSGIAKPLIEYCI